MRTTFFFLHAACLATGICLTTGTHAQTLPATVQSQPTTHEQTPALRLQLSPLTGDFTIFTTWKILGGTPLPSNGMYLVTRAGVVLFEVILSVSTHFHDDRTAGIDFLLQQGVATWSSEKTRELCRLHGDPQAEHVFVRDTVFAVGNYTFRTFYPGEGHTKDNIVIWFGKDKVLYGGCLVKSMENNDLGYLADANVVEWPHSIERVIKEFPSPRYIIPGHFGWEDNRSLQHTLELLRK